LTYFIIPVKIAILVKLKKEDKMTEDKLKKINLSKQIWILYNIKNQTEIAKELNIHRSVVNNILNYTVPQMFLSTNSAQKKLLERNIKYKKLYLAYKDLLEKYKKLKEDSEQKRKISSLKF